MDKIEEYNKVDELVRSGMSFWQISEELNIPISRIKYIRSKRHRECVERIPEKERLQKEFENRVIELVPVSNSINHICSQLRLKGVREYYTKVLRVIEKYKLDTSHFGTYCVVGKTIPKSNEEVFCYGPYSRNSLYRRIVRYGLKEVRCEICGISEWNGKPIRLQLHHIDGDTLNNSFENLQLLCPNCHTQTDTYAGKNKPIKQLGGRIGPEKRSSGRTTTAKTVRPTTKMIKREPRFCCVCGKELARRQKHYCSHECEKIGRPKNRKFTDDELLTEIQRCSSLYKACKKFNMSDTGLKKALKSRGLYEQAKTYLKFRHNK